MTDNEPDRDTLERDLRALGQDLLAGPAPDLRAGVQLRTAQEPLESRRRGARPSRRAMIAAVVASAVISATTAAAVASADVRARLNNLIHFHGIDISRQSGPAPTTIAPTSELGLGVRATFAAAQREATFRIRQPRQLGDPESVLLLKPSAGAVVTLVYRPSSRAPRSAVTGKGAIITQFAGGIDRVVFQKVLLAIAHTRATTVNGAPAIFAEGPQELFLVEADVEPYGMAPRLSDNCLIWATGGVTYRVEAALPLAELREIAESIA
jgi:hypothetical protein